MSQAAITLESLQKRFAGAPVVNGVSLRIEDGEFFSLLGPSGCGKTTLLRMIAGFEFPDTGDIWIGATRATRLHARDRDINMVFQNYALFPHLTVEKNVSFGLEMQKIPSSEIKKRVEEVLAMVRLTGFENRLPKQLSGGQQQRVALARAIVTRPRVLLLDEPLGALDQKLRVEMQTEIKELQKKLGTTFVFVTHDQEEALTMSDRIAVMRGGNIEQLGSPQSIYDRPRTRFVADFIGESNFLQGSVEKLHSGWVLNSKGLCLPVPQVLEAAPGGERLFALRPESVSLEASDEALQGAAVLAAKVSQVTFAGRETRYTVDLPNHQRLVSRMPGLPRFEAGQNVRVQWNPEKMIAVEGDGTHAP